MTKIVPIVEAYTWVVPYVVTRIVDGDTLEGNASIPIMISIPFFNMSVETSWPYKIRVRLEGVNAFEKYKPGGQEAIQFVDQWLANRRDFPLYLTTNNEKDSFGRTLGDLRQSPNHLTGLANDLLQNGHAVPYSRELHGTW